MNTPNIPIKRGRGRPRKHPRPSDPATQPVVPGEAGPTEKKIEPSVEILDAGRRLSFNEVYRYGRATCLGMLKVAKAKKLTAVAMEESDPLAFMDSQAVAMEESISQGHEAPDFPIREAAGKPRHRAVCPTKGSHADVQTWRIRGRGKKDCVCHVCGAIWVQ